MLYACLQVLLGEVRRLLLVRAKERFSRRILSWPYGGVTAEVCAVNLQPGSHVALVYAMLHHQVHMLIQLQETGTCPCSSAQTAGWDCKHVARCVGFV